MRHTFIDQSQTFFTRCRQDKQSHQCKKMVAPPVELKLKHNLRGRGTWNQTTSGQNCIYIIIIIIIIIIVDVVVYENS